MIKDQLETLAAEEEAVTLEITEAEERQNRIDPKFLQPPYKSMFTPPSFLLRMRKYFGVQPSDHTPYTRKKITETQRRNKRKAERIARKVNRAA